ncbi:MAG: hypothetical protein Q9M97_10575 [Candidatus Gracilibacteria bacterium]|nr:hypothetical protein [Candidatus Gracilibacteria bacterium]
MEMDSEQKYNEAELNEKEIFKNMDNMMNLSLKQYELLGVNLDNFKLTQEEIKGLETDPIFLEFEKEMQKQGKSEPSFENMKEEFEKLKNIDITILQKQYKIMAFMFSQVPGFKPFENYIKITKKSFLDTTIETLFNDIEKSFKNFNTSLKKDDKIVIEDRNKYSINIMSNNLGNNKIGVMVYGKAHISDLIKQLKEKYNGRVNIYVAK